MINREILNPNNSTLLLNKLPVFLIAISVILWALLSSFSQEYAEITLTQFYSLLWPTTVIWLILALLPEQQLRNNFNIIVIAAIVIRILGFWSAPILEDDHFRYLWDGYLVLEYGNPYAWTPAEFFSRDDLPNDATRWLDGVSYPDLPTVYGPVCEAIFALSYWLDSSALWPLKFLMICADLGILLLLKRWASIRGWVLYALCPLIIHSFAFNMHTDVLAVFFLLLAFYVQQCNFRQSNLLIAVVAAVAFLTKPFALLALPFLFRLNILNWLVWLGLVISVELCFYLTGGTQWQSVFLMGSNWQFNAGPWLIFSYWASPKAASLIWLILLLACFSIIFYRRYFTPFKLNSYFLPKFQEKPFTIFRGDYLYGVFLLFGAVVNPWYFVWVLVFSAIYPTFWSWTAAAVLMLSYTSGINLSDTDLGLYQIPERILWWEYGLIFVALIADGIYRYQQVKTVARR